MTDERESSEATRPECIETATAGASESLPREMPKSVSAKNVVHTITVRLRPCVRDGRGIHSSLDARVERAHARRLIKAKFLRLVIAVRNADIASGIHAHAL